MTHTHQLRNNNKRYRKKEKGGRACSSHNNTNMNNQASVENGCDHTLKEYKSHLKHLGGMVV